MIKDIPDLPDELGNAAAAEVLWLHGQNAIKRMQIATLQTEIGKMLSLFGAPPLPANDNAFGDEEAADFAAGARVKPAHTPLPAYLQPWAAQLINMLRGVIDGLWLDIQNNDRLVKWLMGETPLPPTSEPPRLGRRGGARRTKRQP